MDIYRKTTSDLLLSFNTAAPSVVNSQVANVGEVKNEGIEINLNGDIVRNDKFYCPANVIFSRNVSEVASLSGNGFERDEIIRTIGSGIVNAVQSITVIRTGLQLGTWYGM